MNPEERVRKLRRFQLLVLAFGLCWGAFGFFIGVEVGRRSARREAMQQIESSGLKTVGNAGETRKIYKANR